jgi:hypothetical protein
MKSRRKLDTIAGRVNADGTIATGDGFTVSKGGTGNYTITFAPGMRLTAAVAGGTLAAGGWAQTGGYSERAFTVLTYSTANVATDIAFSFIAVGMQQ